MQNPDYFVCEETKMIRIIKLIILRENLCFLKMPIKGMRPLIRLILGHFLRALILTLDTC